LQVELDLFHQGERPSYELMLDIVTYLREYSDRHHHPREDVAFERLALRLPELELPLARLRQEHRIILHGGEQLLERINAILEGSLVEREEVETAAASYLVYYRSHIDREEKEVMPRAAEALTGEDWEAVRRLLT
jgi:hemerythrin-like domain-containing protein